VKAQDVRKGDVFNSRRDPERGGSYTVIEDAQILPWPAQPGGDPGPARKTPGVRILVEYPDGGRDARWFEVDQEVPHTRPRYRDYADRKDLVICGDCSTRALLATIPRDEIEDHDAWHAGEYADATRHAD
jgi:hypothetical protein